MDDTVCTRGPAAAELDEAAAAAGCADWGFGLGSDTVSFLRWTCQSDPAAHRAIDQRCSRSRRQTNRGHRIEIE